MKPAEPTRLTIESPSPDEWDEVLSLVFNRVPQEERGTRIEVFRAELLGGRIASEGLRACRREGRLVGAGFAQRQAGKTSVVWPPRLVPGEPRSTAEQLVDALGAWLAETEVRVAHAVLENDDPEDLAVLKAAGFAPLAKLLYMVAEDAVLAGEPPATDLEFEPDPLSHAERLARLLEATYEGTLDCPALDGVRPIEEVIEGYRATGVYSPERWFIVRHEGCDVGCLLLTDHPDSEIWELIYMGLIPSARGRGWGVEISRYAQWLTHRAGRSRLVVAVDMANTPAICMYRAAGFEVWDRRTVLQRVFGAKGRS
jgi:mycothiol synthase